MPGRVLDDWLAYYTVEPWPEARADLRAGLQSAHFHRTMTGESLPIDNFLPDWETDPKTRRQKELEASIRALESLSQEDEE